MVDKKIVKLELSNFSKIFYNYNQKKRSITKLLLNENISILVTKKAKFEMSIRVMV